MTVLLMLVVFAVAFSLILIPVAISESRARSRVTTRVYPPGMVISPQEREHVVTLLISAHEHAKAGSIVPFRAACADHQTFDKKVIGIAREAIDTVIIEQDKPVKPPPEEYVQILADAAVRVEQGRFP